MTAQTYTRCGLPWFGQYDDRLGDIAALAVLKKVQPMQQLELEKGMPPQPHRNSIGFDALFV